MKIEVNVAMTTQSAIPELGQAEKKLYYLIIGEKPEQTILNVGEKTYNGVAKILAPFKLVKQDETKKK